MTEKHPSYLAFILLIATCALISACGQDKSTQDAASAGKAKPEPAAAAPAALPRTAAPAGARVFFVSPADGATVSNPVSIEFGLEGMAVVKAGEDQPNSGHHHLIIDADLPDLSLPIPASDNYVHFGDGSARTERTLAPGTHSLQLLLGDHLHIPHDPPVASKVITIIVE
ncbi:MAG: DUF4399 domain-containing protein [Gammaproteobacteria bacterium]|nr:DUF4399 domain-containing protein [Gammaproteobacteria bacterium]NNC76376.1 DUF4399 domain-containing protein [Woeseiaceae bacterium]